MAIKFHNPKSVSLAGNYSLGAEVPPGARLFYVSGQVGVDSWQQQQDPGIDERFVAQVRPPSDYPVERRGTPR